VTGNWARDEGHARVLDLPLFSDLGDVPCEDSCALHFGGWVSIEVERCVVVKYMYECV
jgi:hypothetical protein